MVLDEYSADMMCMNVTLKANVLKYVLRTKKSNLKQISLNIQSQLYKRILGISTHSKISNEDRLKKVEINISGKYECLETNFKYKEQNVKIVSYASITTGSSFKYIPTFYIEFEKKINKEELFNFIETFIDLLKFLHMRNNIYPELIKYSDGEDEWEIRYILSPDYFVEEAKEWGFFNIGCIEWYSIIDNFQCIFDDFLNKNIYLYYLDNKEKDRLWINPVKIFYYSEFFENTFSLVYGNKIIHSNKSQKIIDEITDLLEKSKNNHNNSYKDTCDYLIKQLDHQTLLTKIEKSLKDNDLLLAKSKRIFNLISKYSNKKIAEKISQIRNFIDHGDREAEINIEIAQCFTLFLLLTNSMLLKRWNINPELISEQLYNLHQI